MKYSYQSKNFGYIGQPDVKTFREVLESFGMTEKEIGEVIMDCERRSPLPERYAIYAPPFIGPTGLKSQDREKSE